jgi:hypothetical protein
MHRATTDSRSSFLRSGAILALVASSILFAQQPVEAIDQEGQIRRVPATREVGRTYFDEVDGTIWARGDDFKASFSDDGVSFIPFLGSSAPRNFPVTMRVEHVTVGTTQLDLAKPNRARREGERITFDHGSMVEIYEVAPTHVEQLFRFDRPHGSGDLVVRLTVDTELETTWVQNGELEFSNDLGGVRYGRPEVVDATGRRAWMESAWDLGSIELRIPEAFLARADEVIE